MFYIRVAFYNTDTRLSAPCVPLVSLFKRRDPTIVQTELLLFEEMYSYK
jgi:hypothetical protein